MNSIIYPHSVIFCSGIYPFFLGPFLLIWFSFNPVRISNYIQEKVWDEITYPFPNFNSATIEVFERIRNCIQNFTGHVITYYAGIEVKPC